MELTTPWRDNEMRDNSITEETYDMRLADARVLKQLGDISSPATTFSIKVSILNNFDAEKLEKITRLRWKACLQSVKDGYENENSSNVSGNMVKPSTVQQMQSRIVNLSD